jgi:hypothetical protein
MTSAALRLVAVALSLTVGGCTPYAAWSGAGMWRPGGDNAANLRAMIAAPHDLVAGQGRERAAGAVAVPPVTAMDDGVTIPATAGAGGAGAAAAGTISGTAP